MSEEDYNQRDELDLDGKKLGVPCQGKKIIEFMDRRRLEYATNAENYHPGSKSEIHAEYFFVKMPNFSFLEK